MADWWTRKKVPFVHSRFAASYRYGFNEGMAGRKMQSKSWFSAAEAWLAYEAGYKEGKIAKEEKHE